MIWLSLACVVFAFAGALIGEYARASACDPGSRAMWLRIIGGVCALAGLATFIYLVFVRHQYSGVSQLYVSGFWGGMAIGQFRTGSADRATASAWLLMSLSFTGLALSEFTHVLAVLYASVVLLIGALLMFLVSWLRRQQYKTQPK